MSEILNIIPMEFAAALNDASVLTLRRAARTLGDDDTMIWTA